MLVFVTFSFFAKLPPAAPIMMNDKLMHFIVFAMLAMAAYLSWPHKPFFPWIAVALTGYGAIIEVVQFFLPWRGAEWLDLLADTAGVIVCGALMQAFIKPHHLVTPGSS